MTVDSAKPMKRVLVVEDEKPYSRALALKLQFAGFEAESAGDGEEALKLLGGDKKFDLMMLDLVMPKMNGFAVLEELEKRDIHLPIIVLSNLAQEEDKKRAKALGAVDFIEKSNSSIVEVIDKVNTFLNKP